MNIKKKGKDFFSRKAKSDFFETPYSMTEQLLENERFDYDRTFLEPAEGHGAIEKILYQRVKIHNLYSYDLCYRQKVDFLKEDRKFDYIITNPPFSLWDEFVQKAKTIAAEKFAFLGRLEFLTGIKRFNDSLYFDSNYPLTRVYLFTRKVNLSFFDKAKEINNFIKNYRMGTDKKKLKELQKKIDYPKLREDGKYPAGMYHYAWFIFENDGYRKYAHNNFPILKWIDNQKYILHKDDLLKGE